MEKITVMGNVGQDPETRVNKNTGSEFYQVTLAASRKKVGSTEYLTTWYVVVFNQKTLLPYIKKGTRILAHGMFRVDGYVDRDGKDRYNLVINSDYIQLINQPVEQTAPAPVEAQESPVTERPPVERRTQTGMALPTVPVTRPATSNLPTTPGLKDAFDPTKFDPNDNDLPF